MSFKNKIINVKAEKIVFPGRSLCRCLDGIALFTEGLLPDETANVLVVNDKKTFREGLLKNIIIKSEKRIEPICSSFGLCGGCSFQNTSYENQIKYKQECILELLNFTGANISKILASPGIWHYRNKMEFSFFSNGAALDLGLHRKGSFDKYISVPPCFIVDKYFLRIIETVKKFAVENSIPAYNNRLHEGFLRHLVLRKAENNNQFLINIVTNAVDSNDPKLSLLKLLVKELSVFSDSIYWTSNGGKSDAVLAEKLTLMHGKPFITERLNVCGKDYFFNISPFSFFQTNSKCAEILYNEIFKLLNPKKEEVLLDLYCGTGTIGISIAQSVRKVIGIDQGGQAIDNAKKNAIINDIVNIEFYISTVENWVKKNRNKFDVFDAVIVDPPRSGLNKSVVEFLLNLKAKKIVYVSCNPSTLARDLQLIIGSGKYKVKEITPIDMFPQTYHVETVVLLELL